MLIRAALLIALALSSTSCPHLEEPVPGTIVRGFAPIGRYAGHWGVDFESEPGSSVAAAEAGTVTFAGEVAGIFSVTVHHGGGLRTSYSYLSEVGVVAGQQVARGDAVGTSGVDHGIAAVHFSVRIGDVYQDPENWFECFRSPAPALSLVPAPGA